MYVGLYMYLDIYPQFRAPFRNSNSILTKFYHNLRMEHQNIWHMNTGRAIFDKFHSDFLSAAGM